MPTQPVSAGDLDRFDLYECCVQSPSLLVRLLRGIHAGTPRVLREDFCGGGALSRRWVQDVAGGLCVAIDTDRAALARLRRLGRSGVRRGAIRIVRADALHPPASADIPRPDVVFVGNFSIGEIHDRPRLIGYLRATRRRLAPGGVFVCDTYGGASALVTGAVRRVHPVPGSPSVRVRYTWEQRSADPLTARVVNALHFRVEEDGRVVREFTDAFVYRWRLWSVPELRDALLEAGFRDAEVYAQVPDAVDSDGRVYVSPVRDPEEVGESYIVCIGARR
jgi:SAM-dependent methyltransferase